MQDHQTSIDLMELARTGDHAAVLSAAATQPPEVVEQVADHLREQDVYHVARQLYEQLLARGESADIHFGIGQCFGKTYEYTSALEHLRRAFELDPGRTDGASYYAYILERHERMEDAEHWYRQAIDAGDADLWTLSHHAWFLEKAGRPEEAEAAYRDVLDRDPGYTWAIKRLALLKAARGQAQEGQRLLEDAVERLPGNPFVRLNLLEFLLTQERLDDYAAQRAGVVDDEMVLPVQVTLALFDLVAGQLSEGRWDVAGQARLEELTDQLVDSVHRDVDDLTALLDRRGADMETWHRLVGSLLT